MNREEFLEMMERREVIRHGTEAFLCCINGTQRALEITAKINQGYHTPEEIRELFSELTMEPVNDTLLIFPPFHADFGQNLHVGQNVTMNAGVSIQDQGGVFIGNNVLL